MKKKFCKTCTSSTSSNDDDVAATPSKSTAKVTLEEVDDQVIDAPVMAAGAQIYLCPVCGNQVIFSRSLNVRRNIAICVGLYFVPQLAIHSSAYLLHQDLGQDEQGPPKNAVVFTGAYSFSQQCPTVVNLVGSSKYGTGCFKYTGIYDTVTILNNLGEGTLTTKSRF